MRRHVAIRGAHARRAVGAVAAIVLGAAAVPADAAPETRFGIVRVTGRIRLSANVPASAALTGGASVDANGLVMTGTTAYQNFSKSVTMSRSGSTATVTIDVQYRVTLDSSEFASAKLTVGFGVSSSAGYVSSDQTISFPAAGSTTPVSFLLAI